jgi:peptide/nickel transport system permease protein
MRTFVFLLKHAAQWVLLALLVAFATFWLSSVIPGDFFSTQGIDSGVRAASVEQLRRQYGLDQPAYVQFSRWMLNLFRMDLGVSLFYQRPVTSVVADALAKTLWIGLPAIILGFGAGVTLGALHGLLGRRPLGRWLDLLSTVGLSLPSLLLGLMALILAARTQWFPLGGMSSLMDPDVGLWHWIADRIRHLVLPVSCLAVPVLASVERIQFAATRGYDDQLYLRSARSRGLGDVRFFFHYVLRPGLNPVLSIAGPMLGAVLSGSLVLEVIFAWPGLGQVTYEALFHNDLFLLAGCVVGSSLLLITGNVLADLALVALDPRTRSLLRRGI